MPGLISDCCMKIKVESTLQNNASIQLESKFGIYKMEQDLVNGKTHYSSTFDDGKYGIWYTTQNNWMLGFTSGRGGVGGVLFVSGSSFSCPTDPTKDWKYLRSSNDWPVAKGVKINCDL